MKIPIQMTAAFDIDGTLMMSDKITARADVLNLYRALEALGAKMYIWSGEGMEHAQLAKELLGLSGAEIIPKGSIIPDLAVDDSDLNLGKACLYV
jgi:hydroxymethylpyrimidine pyrophosphatase-like HAD family hydrolase